MCRTEFFISAHHIATCAPTIGVFIAQLSSQYNETSHARLAASAYLALYVSKPGEVNVPSSTSSTTGVETFASGQTLFVKLALDNFAVAIGYVGRNRVARGNTNTG